ncbi:MAG: acyltransferase family protein [Hyphomicrobiaceae bacterium]
MPGRSPLSYRPDVDGLRAIAVLSVVAYHASPGYAPGGFVGVDIFYVISGYLISSILIREGATGQISLLGFYARRIRRLFPALLVVLTATAALGWFYLLPHELAALGKHLAAGAAYVINIVFRHEAGYFDTEAGAKPLLHLWSLAIEEQFYLVWPILLMLAIRWRHLSTAILLVAGVSLVLCLSTAKQNSAAAFYLPQYRFWELALGALLASLQAVPGATRGPRLPTFSPALTARLSTLSALAGACLLVIGIFLLDAETIYPGPATLLPCLGALLLIAAGPETPFNRILLAHPIPVFIGLISYPLYLWHWPLLSYLTIVDAGGRPSWRLAAVGLALALSVATYLLVERPLRHARGGAIPLLLLALSSLFIVVGLAAYGGGLSPRLGDPQYADIGRAIEDWEHPNGLTAEEREGLTLYSYGSGPQRYLFIGDSNMEQYWPRVKRIVADRADVTVSFATWGGCPPVPGAFGVGAGRPGEACRDFMLRAFERAEADDVKAVVVAAAWRSYFERPGVVFDGPDDGDIALSRPAREAALRSLTDTLQGLARRGKAVWLVLPMPVAKAFAPESIVKRSVDGRVRIREPGLSRGKVDEQLAPLRAELTMVAKASGAGVIDPMQWLCDETSCRGRLDDGTLLYKDSGHLRSSIVAAHASFIDVVFSAGSSPP